MTDSALESLQQSSWLLELPGDLGEKIISFKRGETFSAGTAIGRYEHVGDTFIATIGTELRIIVGLNSPFTDTFSARVITRADGNSLDDDAMLSRIAWN
ncbi:hypothetical protein FPZ24_04860 [Sphingomonas panacisoli]|uniref:Uncharacterized protein n=1 Tax=Sphingomonas panacisoli TaxID=1813879 RepID=A0A5B8LIB1_9SPHN|nr:hypothetical protein [Sphingomonas panacisoli]QDZ06890.1 hypothetical protein FPZ24_04860 [Sphingomonas panacisoli]